MPVWIISILSHVGFKVTSIVLAISLVWLALFSWIKIHDSKVIAKAIASCPPQNIYNGPTTVVQGRKMGCFPLRVGHFGFGFCHD